MGLYTFLFADLRTNAILAELPLVGVSGTRDLKGNGSLVGSLVLGDPKVAALDFAAATQPGRTALYVDRGGLLVWGGVVWTRAKARVAPGQPVRLALGCTEFWSYYRHRLITATATFTGVDQMTIAQSIMNTAVAVTGGDIGVTVTAPTASGITRNLTYNYYDLKVVADAVDQLSQLDQGFDFGVDLAYVAGVPTKTLNWYYPRRGAIAGTTGIIFDKPGNIDDYYFPEDATLMATSVTAVGAGQGDAMLRSTVPVPAQIDIGYPLLEVRQAYKDATAQATLDAHARADVMALQNPVTLPELWVRPDKDPLFGSYGPGDDVRVRITDERFPAATSTTVDRSLDAYYRTLAVGFTPEEGNVPESVHVQLGATG